MQLLCTEQKQQGDRWKDKETEGRRQKFRGERKGNVREGESNVASRVLATKKPPKNKKQTSAEERIESEAKEPGQRVLV